MRSNTSAPCSTYRKFSIVRLALRKLGYSGICMNGWCFSFQVFSDNGCHRQILNLQVLCSNFEKGCEWTGPLSEMEVSLVCILVYPRVASSFVTLVRINDHHWVFWVSFQSPTPFYKDLIEGSTNFYFIDIYNSVWCSPQPVSYVLPLIKGNFVKKKSKSELNVHFSSVCSHDLMGLEESLSEFC